MVNITAVPVPAEVEVTGRDGGGNKRMTRIRRRLVWLVGMSVMALGLVVINGTPASAAGSCATPLNGGNDTLCVNVDFGQVFGDLRAGPRGQDFFHSASITVWQCPTLTTCQPIASVSHGGQQVYVRTSARPAPRGHRFRACGSWTDEAGRRSNTCTLFVAS